MINFIEYKNLPSNFWDKVIYYEYFVSFSGFVKDEPFVFTCDFQIKERSDYIAEDEFMSCFKRHLSVTLEIMKMVLILTIL